MGFSSRLNCAQVRQAESVSKQEELAALLSQKTAEAAKTQTELNLMEEALTDREKEVSASIGKKQSQLSGCHTVGQLFWRLNPVKASKGV